MVGTRRYYSGSMTENPDPRLGPIASRMGITLLDVRPGLVSATMPVAGNTQPYGILHGGASALLAETVGSVAGAMHAGPESYVVGLDLSCTHHRAMTQGHVTAEARPLAEGRTIASYDIRILDEEGRAVCTARLTCLIRPI